MPFRANVLPIMIASPGDVEDERKLTEVAINDWNSAHSITTNLLLMAVGWEQMPAGLDGRPQKLINDALLKKCDLLVGIFWTRLGTSTGKFDSGTVEEIQTHLAAGKPAMIYFSERPLPPADVDSDQYEGVQRFKEWCRLRGIVHSFHTSEEFARRLSNDLQFQLNNHAKLSSIRTSPLVDEFLSLRPAASGDISDDAKELLRQAVRDRNGYIMVSNSIDAPRVMTNDQAFGHEDARSLAKWKAALEELYEVKLVNRTSDPTMFVVTHNGYKKAT
jgi:hypothetical protein